MKEHGPCSPRALATGHVLRVEYCRACDVVSLHFGPLTLRLNPEAAECAWATLGDALSALRAARGRIGSSRLRARAGLAS